MHGHLEGFKASTILVVDDEPTTLEVLEIFLRAEGYHRLVLTTDPRRALDLIARDGPDLLLLNLVMPHVGGLEILQAIGENDALDSLPVIILTSSTEPAVKLRALELGAADFLGKPVDPSELVLRIGNTLAARAYRRLLASQGSHAEGLPRAATSSWALQPGHDSASAKTPSQRASEGTCLAPPLVSRLPLQDPRFRVIVEKFVGRLEQKLAAMEASWQARDFSDLVVLAHWLRGAAGTVGFDAFTGPADELKLAATQRRDGPVQEALRELRALAGRIAIGEPDSAHEARR